MSNPKETKWLNDSPILIYGPRKGGTTLLQNLLDGGDIFVYPTELKLKYLKDYFWTEDQAVQLKKYKDVSIVKPINGLNYEKYCALYNQPRLDSVNGLSQLIQNELLAIYESSVQADSMNPKRWSAKEVGGDTKNIIKLWFTLFDNSKVLMITRNPLNVTRAVLMDRKRRGIKLSLKNIIREVLDPINILTSQNSFKNNPNVYFIRYEDLTDAPAQVINQFCDNFNIPYCDNFLFPSVFGQRTVVATSSRNESKIFNIKKKWYSGLSFIEFIVVAASFSIISIINMFKVKDKLALKN